MKHATPRTRHGRGLGLAAATLLVGLTPGAAALAGGAVDAAEASDQLGVRMARPVTEVEPGRSYEVIVEDPQRLARHGIEGVEQGQRLQVTLSGKGRAGKRATGNNPFLGKDSSGKSGSGGERQTGNNPFLKVEVPGGGTTRLGVGPDGQLEPPTLPVADPSPDRGGQGFAKPASGKDAQYPPETSPEMSGKRSPGGKTVPENGKRLKTPGQSQPGARGDYPAPDNFADSPDGTTARGGGESFDKASPKIYERGEGAGRGATAMPDQHGPQRSGPSGNAGKAWPKNYDRGNGGQGPLGSGARGEVPDGTELNNPTPSDALREGKDPDFDNPDGTTLRKGGDRAQPDALGKGAPRSGSDKTDPRADHGPAGLGPGIQSPKRTPGSGAASPGPGGGPHSPSPESGSSEALDKASPNLQRKRQLGDDDTGEVLQRKRQLREAPGQGGRQVQPEGLR